MYMYLKSEYPTLVVAVDLQVQPVAVGKLAGLLLPLNFFDREAHFYFSPCAKTNTSAKNLTEAYRYNMVRSGGSEREKSLCRSTFFNFNDA